ncbi:hypothetical protein Ahy_B02g059733 [Arachis hypogaea]|uniref:RING-type domain-containing protein n=1 Tax=Arachis hypogaea TaxID=3818 RepID=A0A445AH30_ARAHY|nr:hypothetical protein Ahy_B02g059733 [Arachis hypogaea]
MPFSSPFSAANFCDLLPPTRHASAAAAPCFRLALLPPPRHASPRLPRSIRQEVSAALNRSTGSSGTRDHDSPDDKSKWECVRKGVCCICCESNIDSLLYRCGHMCTCSNCANDLHRSGRKCPMCQAPVVEVIRAYSIL